MRRHGDEGAPTRDRRRQGLWRCLPLFAALLLPAFSADAQAPESRAGAGFFMRTEHVSAPAAAFHRTRFDMGLRFRPLDHLALDVGLGLGFGRMRRPSGPQRVSEMGLALDLVAYLNPRDRAQAFVVGGLGVGLASSTDEAGRPSSDVECPADNMLYVDTSIGLGLEVAVSRDVSLVGSTRLVRRGAYLGDLTFLKSGTNPPSEAVGHALGVSAELRLILHFRAVAAD
ncbi:MAG: hypothetical protein H6721_21290 [Sandaracinus sp.]|nr:hypothetical protein [Sandaracinus sp.]